MGSNKYTMASAIEMVNSKRGVKVSTNQIDLSSAKERIGNSTWGAIDYLVKNHKYVVTGYPKSISEE